MATIKQGILGGFSGSVANVVGTAWKGTAVMKSKPVSVSNPRTEGQVAQRTSFKAATQLASVLLVYVIKAIYNPIAQGMSGYNKFVSQNKGMFNGVGEFVPANAFLGGGSLITSPITSVEFNALNKQVLVTTMNPAAPGSPRDTDKMYGYAYEPVSGSLWAVNVPSLRSDEESVMPIIFEGDGLSGVKNIYVGVCPVSSDGRQIGTAQQLSVFQVNFGA